MNILSEKINLRAPSQKDNDMLLEVINDPETEYMLGGASFPISPEEQIKWFQNLCENSSLLRCVIEDKKSGEAVGTIILSDIDYRNGTAQVHIKLKPGSVRHCGFGTNALSTMTAFAFEELRLNCVFATISQFNIPSKGLFEKCGYKFEGVLRSRVFKRGHSINVMSYSILCDEYQKAGDASCPCPEK